MFELQALPQAPQFEVVVRFVSQPFPTLPSQLPRPGLQVMPLHTPPLHCGVPPDELQTFPQMPQLLVVVRSVSQPLFALLSQLPQPELHAIWQEPPEQEGVPCVELQTAPHAPQCAVLVAVLVSQPLATFPSQFPQPEEQEMLQLPETHEGVPLFVLHASPQPPQCEVLELVCVSHPLVTLLSQFP